MPDVIQEILRAFDSVALIGMCKNAGKTTVFNQLLRQAREQTVLALTSIGRDGETVDLVTGTEKPRIYIREGTLLATAAGLLPSCDITREIVAHTGMHTPMGDVIVLRARSDGYVQLAGPSMVAQQLEVSRLFRELGADKIIVDGAAGRKSLCTRRLAQATVLCTGASCGRDMEAVVAEAAYTCRLLTLPEADRPGLREAAEGAKMLLAGRELIALAEKVSLAEGLRAHPDNNTSLIYMDGALTDATARNLLRSGVKLEGLTLVTRDPARIFLTEETALLLERRGCGLAVLDGVHLAAVTVNPYSVMGYDFDATAFRQRMAEAVPVPVVNVREDLR